MSSVLLSGPWERLKERLAGLVRLDPARLLLAERRLLAAGELLEAMMREVPATLADDRDAAERLRLLVSLSSHSQIGRLTIESVLGGEQPPNESLPSLPANFVHYGNLVALGLASLRLEPNPKHALAYLDAAFGVAFAMGPTERFSAAIESGLDDEQLLALLRGLAAASEDSSSHAAMSLFVTDANERARWRCLESLRAALKERVGAHAWDAAVVEGVAAALPVDACPDTDMQIHLGDESGGLVELLLDGRGSILFEQPGTRTLVRSVESVDPWDRILVVKAPSIGDAWVAVVHPELVARARAYRMLQREAWSSLNKEHACLRDAPVPVHLISLPGTPPSFARRVYWPGGLPRFVHAVLEPEVVRPGGSLRLAWRVEGSNRVHLLPAEDGSPGAGPFESTGEVSVRAPFDAEYARFSLQAENDCGLQTRELESRVEGGELHIVAVRPATISRDPENAEATPDASFVLEDVTHRLQRVPFTVVEEAVRGVATELDVKIRLSEPPWIHDEDLHIEPQRLEPAKAFEALARIAARSPGGEHAIWVMVVPGQFAPRVVVNAVNPDAPSEGASSFVASGAESARAVILTGPQGLDQAIAWAVRNRSELPVSDPDRRLRIEGHVALVPVESSRIDTDRPAGPGAPVALGLIAVIVDEAGEILGEHELRGYSDRDGAKFVALLRVPPGAASLEIRRGSEVLQTIARVRGAVGLADVSLRGRQLGWRATATAGLRVSSVVEIEQEGLRSIVSEADRFVTGHTFRRQRLAARGTDLPVRVVTTDGWLTAEESPDNSLEPALSRVAIRRSAKRVYWADVEPEGARVEWEIKARGGRGPLPAATGRAVRVPGCFDGELLLRAAPDGLEDAIRVHHEVEHG